MTNVLSKKPKEYNLYEYQWYFLVSYKDFTMPKQKDFLEMPTWFFNIGIPQNGEFDDPEKRNAEMVDSLTDSVYDAGEDFPFLDADKYMYALPCKDADEPSKWEELIMAMQICLSSKCVGYNEYNLWLEFLREMQANAIEIKFKLSERS